MTMGGSGCRIDHAEMLTAIRALLPDPICQRKSPRSDSRSVFIAITSLVPLRVTCHGDGVSDENTGRARADPIVIASEIVIANGSSTANRPKAAHFRYHRHILPSSGAWRGPNRSRPDSAFRCAFQFLHVPSIELVAQPAKTGFEFGLKSWMNVHPARGPSHDRVCLRLRQSIRNRCLDWLRRPAPVASYMSCR